VKAKIVEFGIDPAKIIPIPAFTRQYLDFYAATLSPDIESHFARFSHVVFTYVRVRPGFNLPTLIEAFALVARARPDVSLLLVGLTDDVDAEIWRDVRTRIAAHRLEPRMCIVDELDHDEFLTVLTRCACYLRTPTTDGVASSVLEALALRVPTVAAENGSRPAGVVTFASDDARDLADKLEYTLANRERLAASLPPLEIGDTLMEEVRLLTGAVHSTV
jgi:glycosyltransferase involved in cell wall biosynthesis